MPLNLFSRAKWEIKGGISLKNALTYIVCEQSRNVTISNPCVRKHGKSRQNIIVIREPLITVWLWGQAVYYKVPTVGIEPTQSAHIQIEAA